MLEDSTLTGPPIPSVNPSNYGSMTGAFRQILHKALQDTADMLPAKVVTYDREAGRAQVQPLIAILKTDLTQVTRAMLTSIPVLHLGGGGFVLDFNLQPGDLGWIKANDRDISIFLQSYLESRPNTYRLHSFEDAVFIPDIMRGYTINAEDAENVVLQTVDGTQRVAIWADRVKITSTNRVIIDAPDAQFTGDIHADGDIVAGTISLRHHRHSGVDSGPSDTGPPVI